MLNTRRRVVVVEREVGSARLEHAQQRRHHVDAAQHQDAHDVTRAHAQADQVVSDAVGARLDLGMGSVYVVERSLVGCLFVGWCVEWLAGGGATSVPKITSACVPKRISEVVSDAVAARINVWVCGSRRKR